MRHIHLLCIDRGLGYSVIGAYTSYKQCLTDAYKKVHAHRLTNCPRAEVIHRRVQKGETLIYLDGESFKVMIDTWPVTTGDKR